MNKYIKVISAIELVNGDLTENDTNTCVLAENKLKVLSYFHI